MNWCATPEENTMAPEVLLVVLVLNMLHRLVSLRQSETLVPASSPLGVSRVTEVADF